MDPIPIIAISLVILLIVVIVSTVMLNNKIDDNFKKQTGMRPTDISDIKSDIATLQKQVGELQPADLSDIKTNIAALKDLLGDLKHADITALEALLNSLTPAAISSLLGLSGTVAANKTDITALQNSIYGRDPSGPPGLAQLQTNIERVSSDEGRLIGDNKLDIMRIKLDLTTAQNNITKLYSNITIPVGRTIIGSELGLGNAGYAPGNIISYCQKKIGWTPSTPHKDNIGYTFTDVRQLTDCGLNDDELRSLRNSKSGAERLLNWVLVTTMYAGINSQLTQVLYLGGVMFVRVTNESYGASVAKSPYPNLSWMYFSPSIVTTTTIVIPSTTRANFGSFY